MAVGYTTTLADAMIALIDSCYIQLHSGDPGSAGTANVISGQTRQQITLGAGATVSTDRVRSPNADLTFSGLATGTISHFSVWSAVSSGTFKMSGTISPNKTLANSGDVFILPVGDLDFVLGPLAA